MFLEAGKCKIEGLAFGEGPLGCRRAKRRRRRTRSKFIPGLMALVIS
jgi:hypothetical protein